MGREEREKRKGKEGSEVFLVQGGRRERFESGGNEGGKNPGEKACRKGRKKTSCRTKGQFSKTKISEVITKIERKNVGLSVASTESG